MHEHLDQSKTLAGLRLLSCSRHYYFLQAVSFVVETVFFLPFSPRPPIRTKLFRAISDQAGTRQGIWCPVAPRRPLSTSGTSGTPSLVLILPSPFLSLCLQHLTHLAFCVLSFPFEFPEKRVLRAEWHPFTTNKLLSISSDGSLAFHSFGDI